MRVLLVEDSKLIRQLNETALSMAGCQVICAADGESALRLAHEEQPDLILLDMILPKLSGVEVLRALKRNPSTVGIPVVVVSSLSEKNRQKLVEEGAEDYLEKKDLMPSQGVNLLPKMLKDIMSRMERKRELASSNTSAR